MKTIKMNFEGKLSTTKDAILGLCLESDTKIVDNRKNIVIIETSNILLIKTLKQLSILNMFKLI